ncbi:hypothetical protein OK349_07555 [Sphingomonas sp. BT-65]|uniref:DUF6607 family protein n=1 Tax=Sphingomonas sp. BT-65 TaxID=2989821 RepID=UPI0022367FBF|nr:DUF6607 family protein [Sphingomonas sp. BT-65]MCW4461559.1 hypothetical protein [Sphingomonas sp. BT-65]
MKKMMWIAGAALIASTAPALADGPVKPRAEAEEQSSFEADRRDILAMAGNYKVKFDMRESTPWRADYTPIEAKVSGGHESVRVIEDTGRVIRLQHLLVVSHEGKDHVIKHWRQDWEYEPARVLVYSGPDSWTWEDVPERMRKGRWSQTVYQVDDSPRYGGWGQWTSEAGIRRWRSNWTWRPLARRDAVRGPVYDRYYAINRHQAFPGGWIHWQDNTKMGEFDGKLEPVVQEYVLNTYTRFDGYKVQAADDYWAATKGYWAAIRGEWDRIAAAKNGIRITEAAEAGTVIASRLLGIADEIQSGKTKEADGIKTAKALMDQATRAAGQVAAN